MTGGSLVGVDIGGSKVLAVLASPDGEVMAQAKLATPGDVDAVVRAVLAAAAQVGDAERTLALGVGCPGMIDQQGKAHFCPHLHCLDGVELQGIIAGHRAGGARTLVVNDATAACWAEYQIGAGRATGDLVMVTLGTGIGGGMVAGGRLVSGAHGFAGELGHMVVDPSGPACPCGKKGCWERFASGSGLGRLAREAAEAGRLESIVSQVGGVVEDVRAEHVTVAAAQGDLGALDVMAQFAWWVALGLANLANALDPAAIIIGGGLVEAGAVLMGPVRNAFSELVEGPRARAVRLVPAALGERAGAVGAALLAAGIRLGR
ncbi:MAG TPA: ROK family protein [Acidimicrobiales bacterium]|nr:ROK family protein [Acidimicrobiales bacterium]